MSNFPERVLLFPRGPAGSVFTAYRAEDVSDNEGGREYVPAGREPDHAEAMFLETYKRELCKQTDYDPDDKIVIDSVAKWADAPYEWQWQIVLFSGWPAEITTSHKNASMREALTHWKNGGHIRLIPKKHNGTN